MRTKYKKNIRGQLAQIYSIPLLSLVVNIITAFKN